jgi:hypothetical protein
LIIRRYFYGSDSMPIERDIFPIAESRYRTTMVSFNKLIAALSDFAQVVTMALVVRKGANAQWGNRKGSAALLDLSTGI